MDKLPTHMTAVAISKPGGPEVLIPEQRPVPQPGPNQVLIKVAAAGVNRPDVAQRSGSYPPPPGASDLPGLEVAGEVVALGEGVTKRKIGDKGDVAGRSGGYAEYCLTHETHAIPGAEQLLDDRSCCDARNADDCMAQRVRARRIEARAKRC